ncbi:cytochrome P450 [Suillus paluster]|uniref:cytochrome P450 n=1 Tax=Suillus paluster TaxID=48578 RepID=UPI001B8699A6|nr:cytochrome P450 [Suillus paluster]KAG1754084.1 cytochrome P450 [Suillus paluster]
MSCLLHPFGSLEPGPDNRGTCYHIVPLSWCNPATSSTLENTKLVLAFAACFGVGAAIRGYLTSGSKYPLPPSPTTWGLWGHVLPYHRSYLTVEKWIEELGPVISFRSGTRRIVIIGRQKKCLAADSPSPFHTLGKRLHHMRRALHLHLGPRSLEQHELIQLSYAKDMVMDIIDDPSNFQNHTLTFVSSVIMKVAYGKNTRTFAGDLELKDARQRIEELGKSQRPGAYLVDSIPWLRYIPWYGKDLREGFERGRKIYTASAQSRETSTSTYRLVILSMMPDPVPQQRNEDIGPSFAKYMLETEHSYPFTELERAWLVGSLLLASNTTAAALCTVLMVAALFPEEQAKVQAEFDAVIGRNRGSFIPIAVLSSNDVSTTVPTFADENSLPLLRAFIAECQRWRPSAAEVYKVHTVGLAHQTTKDENYCIPAGTTVFGNHWAISRDPDVFPDPHAFKPERWLNDQGGLRKDHKFYTFGFGRRVCPAQHLVPRSVFIHSLLVLWAFRMTLDPTKPADDMGYMIGVVPDIQPCTVQFESRVPESALRRMMQKDPEVA